jgi:hypothetical protein
MVAANHPVSKCEPVDANTVGLASCFDADVLLSALIATIAPVEFRN